MRVSLTQPSGDLLRRVLAQQILSDNCSQLRVRSQFGWLRPTRALVSGSVRSGGAVTPVLVGVPGQLPTDCGGAPVQLLRYLAQGLARCHADGDLLTFGEGQTPALQISAPFWADTAAGSQPASALLPVGADLLGRISDEFPGLNGSSRRLHPLRDHPFRKHDHCSTPASQVLQSPQVPSDRSTDTVDGGDDLRRARSTRCPYE